jgi:hypothetical protein
MSEYLHAGWYEFLLPAVSGEGAKEYLRIWIDMEDVARMLRQLDLRYGDRDHPYALNAAEIPDAQRTLLTMVAEHVLAHPEAVRRAAASRRFASELWERFRIGPSPRSLPYPPVIDQADLDPAKVCLALPFIIDRAALSLPRHGGLP